MQHLSRRFSGFVFLYIVIAQIVFNILFNIGLFSNTMIFYTIEPFAFYFRLLHWFFVFLLPIIFIAARRYPVAGVLRLNTFSGRQLLFAVVLAIFIYLFINTFGSILNNLYYGLFIPDFQTDYFSATGFSLWPAILTSCLIPAILYELTFRGAVQSGFRNIDPLKACLLVSILFGLFQMSAFSLIQYTIYGFVLCYISNKSGSIIPGMVTVLLVLLFRTINLDGWLYFDLLAPTGISQGLAALIMALISIIIGGVLLWKMPDTSGTSRQIHMPKIGKIGQFLKKLPEFRRRLQQSFLSDYDEGESKKDKKLSRSDEPAAPTVLNEEIYPVDEPRQSKNTGFIIGGIILIAYMLFTLGYSIYYYIKMVSEYMQF